MRIRKALVSMAVGGSLVASTLGIGIGMAPAEAAPAGAGQRLAPMDSCACHPPGPGWDYIDYYFWASSCASTGNGGIQQGRWHAYQCTGGGPFSNYELWVR